MPNRSEAVTRVVGHDTQLANQVSPSRVPATAERDHRRHGSSAITARYCRVSLAGGTMQPIRSPHSPNAAQGATTAEPTALHARFDSLAPARRRQCCRPPCHMDDVEHPRRGRAPDPRRPFRPQPQSAPRARRRHHRPGHLPSVLRLVGGAHAAGRATGTAARRRRVRVH